MEYISNKDKKGWQEIIFQQLSKILELSNDEFRGGYTDKKIVGGVVEEIYIPDSRKKVIQAIEFFAILLEPHFKKETKEKYTKIMGNVKSNLKEYSDKKIDYEEFIINKLNYMKKIFRLLNFLLYKLDYFKGTNYQEVGKQDIELSEEDLKWTTQ